MEKNKKRFLFWITVLFVLSLSGCAKQPEQVSGVVDTAVKTEVNWEQGFAVGEVKQVQEWNTCDFQRISLTHTGEGDYTGGSVRTDNLRGYVETAVYKTEESENYYVKRFLCRRANIYKLQDFFAKINC